MTRVDLSKTAEKEFAKLPRSEQRKVLKKLELLETQPLSGKKLGGELENFRTFRAWPHRIIYHLDKAANQVVVDHILHRQGTYK